MRVPGFFKPIMKWVCPLFLGGVFVLWLLKEVFGYDLTSAQAGSVSYYVTDLAGPSSSLPAQLAIALVLAIYVFFALLTSRSKAFQLAESGRNKHEA